MVGTKHIDPALCIYTGVHLMCIDNKHLKDKIPRGNGTICKVLSIKLKDDQQSYKWKNYYGKKVWTVNASDVEWLQCEHVQKPGYITQLQTEIQELTTRLKAMKNPSKSKTQEIESIIKNKTDDLSTKMNDLKFKLEPEQFSPTISIPQFHGSKKRNEFRCKMKQIPANMNDATTGHKLQGMSKDVIIITSWPTGTMFKNWEYVVLSRARTISGLYLVHPIDMEKNFEPSNELKRYMIHAKHMEQTMLQKLIQQK